MTTKWARIQDNAAVEFINFDPVGCFHPDIQWLPVPEALEPHTDLPLTVSDGELVLTSLDSLRAKVKGQVAAARYEKEVGGFTINGITIATDRESQSKILSALYGLEKSFATSVDYKSDNGFVTLDVTQLTAVSNAVFSFVQACFTNEGTHSAAIDTAELSELLTYDVTVGWPSNVAE